MFFSKKPVFANKGALQTEPFCPYITDNRGYNEFRRARRALHVNLTNSPKGYLFAEPTLRSRKSTV